MAPDAPGYNNTLTQVEVKVHWARMLAALRVTHLGIVLYVLLGWLLPSTGAHITHALVAAVLILHWRTNKGQCVLSEIETKIKRRRDPGFTAQTEEGQFIRSVLGLCFRRLPSHRALEAFIQVVTFASGSYSLYLIFL